MNQMINQDMHQVEPNQQETDVFELADMGRVVPATESAAGTCVCMCGSCFCACVTPIVSE